MGLLVLFLVALSPLLSRYGPSWRLTAKELATATAIMLFACCVPGRSLMHVFTNQLMMPFAVSGLALTDRSGGKTLPVAAWGIAAMVLALAIAVPTTLYWQYRYGSASTSDYYVGNARPRMAFETDARMRQKLQAQGLLNEEERLSGWARLWHAPVKLPTARVQDWTSLPARHEIWLAMTGGLLRFNC